MTPTERGLELARRTLKIGLGLGAFLAGLDKFFDILTSWEMYLAPWMESALPFSTGVFFGIVGVIEMAAGLLVLSKWTRIGAYVVAAWLAAIAIQLVTTGTFFDLAVRDLEMALGAFALAKLSEWHAVQPATAG